MLPPRGSLSHPPAQGFDDSTTIQEKIGNYGEGIFLKEHRKSLKKTKWINGVLTDRDLLFQGTDRHSYRLPYRALHAITLQRSGLFSAADRLTIRDMNGHVSSYSSVAARFM